MNLQIVEIQKGLSPSRHLMEGSYLQIVEIQKGLSLASFFASLNDDLQIVEIQKGLSQRCKFISIVAIYK